MKLHYFSEEYSYLYDEANERYYRVKSIHHLMRWWILFYSASSENCE